MKDWNKELTKYPKPGKQKAGVSVKALSASGQGLAQQKTVKAGTIIPDGGEKASVKGGGAATKGLLWYRYIK